MATITWLNKIDGSDPGDPQKNVNAADMNLIKTVVNTNDGNTTTVATNLATHAALTNNPHSVTKTQVGLPLADNTADANKEVSGPQQTALDLKANIANPTFTTGITTPLVKITGGSPGANKFLMSDADGDGSWANVAVGSITGVLGIANGGNGTTNGISTETQAALNLKAGRDAFAIGVVPSGSINGVNTAFVCPQTPYAGSVEVFLNGLRMIEGISYTFLTATVTFITPPETGDTVIFNYIRP